MDKHLTQLSGYTFKSIRHASAIIESDFPGVVTNLFDSLDKFGVKPSDIMKRGGGLSPIVQNLNRILNENGWHEQAIDYEVRVNGNITEKYNLAAEYFYLEKGSMPGISLVVEWNNKDPFFDRDLEQFKRMHSLGLISAGILITRGESLQTKLLSVFRKHFEEHPDILDDEIRKIKGLTEKVQRNPKNKINIAAKALFSSKFGQATTHWDKLVSRTENKGGDPCPLLLIGVEAGRMQ